MTRNTSALMEPTTGASSRLNPLHFGHQVGGRPRIDFHWQEVNGKKRLIGNPNPACRAVHNLFEEYIRQSIQQMQDGYTLRRLPSSTAFVKESNPLQNALKHQNGTFFYITDIHDAYPRVDLERLAALIVYIKMHDMYGADFSLRMLGQNEECVTKIREGWLYAFVHAFLELYCSGIHGKGLAVGGPLSPYLFNLYCEVFIDSYLRRLCEKYDITYTRYADDCVFSRTKPIVGGIRRDIRHVIERAGFTINHRKSKVLSREMGTVFVTKIGLHNEGTSVARLVFPQKKRRRLHGIIVSYLTMQMDWPRKVSGLIAEFIYYYKNVGTPTATDRKTFALCKKFKQEWAKHSYD